MACVCQRPPSFLVDRRASRSSALAIRSRAIESLCSVAHANLWIVHRVTRGYRVVRSRASFDCLSGATDFKLIVRARGLTHTRSRTSTSCLSLTRRTRAPAKARRHHRGHHLRARRRVAPSPRPAVSSLGSSVGSCHLVVAQHHLSHPDTTTGRISVSQNPECGARSAECGWRVQSG